MERYVYDTHDHVENAKVDVFLTEIEKVYRKHGLCLGHEDGEGGFIVEPIHESNVQWLMAAGMRGIKQ